MIHLFRMKKHVGQIVIKVENIDEKRNHAGLVGQSAIVVDALTDLMITLDLGLDKLKEESKCRFMLTRVKDMAFIRQLMLGDTVTVDILMWVATNYSLEFYLRFIKEGKIATETRVVMNLIHTESGQLVVIPQSIVQVVGSGKPEPWQFQPASSS